MSFVIKESFKLILRSKLNFILNLISLTLCVLLIVLSFYLVRASKYLQEYVQQNISLNIFIKDNINSEYLKIFSERLSSQPFTSKIEFVSKEKAAEIFLKETGEDFRKILEYNPLPASFILYLKNEYTSGDSINKVINEIQREEIVTEVVSKMEFLQKVISFSEKAKMYIFIFTGFILIVSIYLVYSTVKLIMNSKYDELETMKLVGAKLSTIKLPIIINIVLIGLIAGIICLAIFYTTLTLFSIDFKLILNLTGIDLKLLVLMILILGPVIGSFVTIVALRKISLRV
ncbi:MAG: cell division protein FtsX [Ignavibacterium sp.]